MEATARGIRRRTLFDVTDSLLRRFNPKVLVREASECWPWLGAVRNGYGCIKHDNGLLSAHVVAWVIANKRNVADGCLVCHTCDNRLCCNPSHLYEGTYADNVRDMDKRRAIPRPRGQQMYNSVLTDEIARLILSLRVVNGWGQRRISNALCLNEGTVDCVIRRTTWTHVDVPSQSEAAEIVYSWKASKQ